MVDVEWGDRLAISLPGPDSVRFMGLCGSGSSSASTCDRKVSSKRQPNVRDRTWNSPRGSPSLLAHIAEQVAGVRPSAVGGRDGLCVASFVRSTVMRQSVWLTRCVTQRLRARVWLTGSRTVDSTGDCGGCDRLSAIESHFEYVTPRSVNITEWRR